MKDFEENKNREELIKRALKEELSYLEKEPSPRDWQAVACRLNLSRNITPGGIDCNKKKASSRRFKIWPAASLAAALAVLLVGGIFIYQGGFLARETQPEMTQEELPREETERDQDFTDESGQEAGLAEGDATLMEEPLYDARVPAFIGDMEYQKTLGYSTEELLYLLYASREQEMLVAKAQQAYFDREALLERVEEDTGKELSPLTVSGEFFGKNGQEIYVFKASPQQPLLGWETSENLWLMWSPDDGLSQEELIQKYDYLP